MGGTLTVLAATPLQAVLLGVDKEFRQENPGVHVTFRYADSSSLVKRIQRGTTADVFASRATSDLDRVTRHGLASGTPRVFTRDPLTIVTAQGNPEHITVQNLADPGVKVDVCAPGLSCGTDTPKFFQKDGMTVMPVGEESSASDVVANVSQGRADAGIVPWTDFLSNDDPDRLENPVTGAPIPADENVIAPWSVVHASNRRAAAAFVDFLVGPSGQLALDEYMPAS